MANELTINEYASELILSTQRMVASELATKAKGVEMPEGYNFGNEVNTAMYKLAKTMHNNVPLLQYCYPDSVIMAVKNMCMLGLSVSKNQCYMIPYGKELQLQLSYFGNESFFKRMYPHLSVGCNVIYEGEDFHLEADIEKGFTRVVDHTPDLDCFGNPIKGVYGTIWDKRTKEVIYAEVMSKRQIDVSWSKAKTKNVQREFPDQMAKRTLMNRMMKRFINSSPTTNAGLAEIYNEAVANEYEDRQPVDITPEEREVKKVLKSKSRGKEGLKEVLRARANKEEDQVVEAKPVLVEANGEIVEEVEEVRDEDDDLMDVPF